jgi:hypothetical protein
MADASILNAEFLKKQKKLEYQRKYRANLADDVKASNNAKVAENNRNRYNSDATYKQAKNETDKQRVKDYRAKAKLYEESLKVEVEAQALAVVNPPTDPYYCKYCNMTYNKAYFQKHLLSSKHSINSKKTS